MLSHCRHSHQAAPSCSSKVYYQPFEPNSAFQSHSSPCYLMPWKPGGKTSTICLHRANIAWKHYVLRSTDMVWKCCTVAVPGDEEQTQSTRLQQDSWLLNCAACNCLHDFWQLKKFVARRAKKNKKNLHTFSLPQSIFRHLHTLPTFQLGQTGF